MLGTINLQTQYYLRISRLIHNETILYMKEHYDESPNWKLNNDNDNMITTLIWLTYSDKEKKDKLDDELNDYLIN